MKRSRSGGRGAVIAEVYSTDVAELRPLEPEPDPAPGPSGPRPVRLVDLDWRSVAVALGALVALLAVTGIVRKASHTVTAVIIGTLLALAMNPLVSAAQHRVGRRSSAVAVVLTGFTLTVVGLVALLGPPAVRQGRQLQDQLPDVIRQLNDLPVVGPRLERSHASEKVQDWIETLPDRLAGNTAPIERAGRAVFNGVLAVFLTLLVAVALMLDGARLVQSARRLVPVHRRAQADRIGDLAYRVVGRYVAGSVLVAGIAGMYILAVGLVLRVPLTPMLAVWVAVFDLVPQIGGAVGGIPFVALAFTHSALAGVLAGVLFVLYLQLENHLIQPVVVGRTVHLSPPATMTAALVGVSAAGVVGALVAVPLLGAAKVTYQELRRPQIVIPGEASG